MEPETIREQANAARAKSEAVYKSSEYPNYGKGCYLRVASALDDLAEVLDRIGAEPPELSGFNGNSFEQRKARRVYWLRRKAAEAHVTSARTAASAHDMGASRPLGQPLVGSPARMRTQRNAIEKQHRRDGKAHREYEEAEELERRASAAERNTSIYRQDPDSLVKLRAKLANLEGRRDRIKENKPKLPPILNYRSPDGVRVQNRYHNEVNALPQVDMTRAELKRKHSESKSTNLSESRGHRVRIVMSVTGGHLGLSAVFVTDSKEHEKPGADELPHTGGGERVPAYVMSNLGANIRRVKQQIEEHQADDEREERPPRRIGDVEVLDNLEHLKVELHFPGKPDDATRSLLKSHGFRWIRTVGCWSRGINSRTEYSLGELAKHLGHELEAAPAE